MGGGTRPPTHLPCLEMPGRAAPGSALKLGEFFAATCLAGEIYVLAATAPAGNSAHCLLSAAE
jgi:hypothetical protein